MRHAYSLSRAACNSSLASSRNSAKSDSPSYLPIINFVAVTQFKRSTALRLSRINSHSSQGSSSTHFPTPPRVGVVLYVLSIRDTSDISSLKDHTIDSNSSTRALFATDFSTRVQRVFLPSGYLTRWPASPCPFLII